MLVFSFHGIPSNYILLMWLNVYLLFDVPVAYQVCRVDAMSVLSSQSHVTTDGQLASLSWCQATSGAQEEISVTVRQLRVCSCGAPSLTRGRVCRLLLLMVLASAVVSTLVCGTDSLLY
jgi:hypothetical protein